MNCRLELTRSSITWNALRSWPARNHQTAARMPNCKFGYIKFMVALKPQSWQGELYLIKAGGRCRRWDRQPRPALWRHGSMKTFLQKPHHHQHSCCIGQRFISELGKQALGDAVHPIPQHLSDLNGAWVKRRKGGIERDLVHFNHMKYKLKEIKQGTFSKIKCNVAFA